jgi:exopolysaccharide biosynthesis WecB/TagA/CpsF family protein
MTDGTGVAETGRGRTPAGRTTSRLAGPAVQRIPVHPASPAKATLRRRSPASFVTIDDTGLNVATEAEVVERVVADATTGTGGTVFTLNLDHLVKLETDPSFRLAYDRAKHVTADGVPVVLMARAAGANIRRVTGADLVVPLCQAAAKAGIPVHLFGTTEDVLAKAAQTLVAEAPGLVVAGTESPPFGFNPYGPQARASAERIAASGAGICFVALGAPKQELFADTAATWSPGVTFVCIGAALDFIAGTQKRAPRLVQTIGFEWAWRLMHDPRRLSKRYVRSALYLFRYVARHTASGASRSIRSLYQGLARDFHDPADRK